MAVWLDYRPQWRISFTKHALGIRGKVKIDRVEGEVIYHITSMCWFRFYGGTKERQLLEMQMLTIGNGESVRLYLQR